MNGAALHQLGVADTLSALSDKTVSSFELTRHLLARIDRHAALGAFLHLDPAGALAAALDADQRRARGDLTPLDRKSVV